MIWVALSRESHYITRVASVDLPRRHACGGALAGQTPQLELLASVSLPGRHQTPPFISREEPPTQSWGNHCKLLRRRQRATGMRAAKLSWRQTPGCPGLQGRLTCAGSVAVRDFNKDQWCYCFRHGSKDSKLDKHAELLLTRYFRYSSVKRIWFSEATVTCRIGTGSFHAPAEP